MQLFEAFYLKIVRKYIVFLVKINWFCFEWQPVQIYDSEFKKIHNEHTALVPKYAKSLKKTKTIKLPGESRLQYHQNSNVFSKTVMGMVSLNIQPLCSSIAFHLSSRVHYLLFFISLWSLTSLNHRPQHDNAFLQNSKVCGCGEWFEWLLSMNENGHSIIRIHEKWSFSNRKGDS